MFAETTEQVPLDTAIALLKPLLEDDAVLKIGQNIKYDLNVLARYGIAVSPIDDTMVESFCLDAGRSADGIGRSEEHTSELQSLMRISYAVFCLKNKQQK